MLSNRYKIVFYHFQSTLGIIFEQKFTNEKCLYFECRKLDILKFLGLFAITYLG